MPPSKVLNVPVYSQLPQLPNGCEVTSLSMLLTAVHHPVDKMTLAKEMPKDPTKRVMAPNGTIQSWGNPNVGFVGDVYVQPAGFGIYHGPMTQFLSQLMPHQALDLTGKPFVNILRSVNGIPVVIWNTVNFQPTSNWMTWKSPEGPVRATMMEHAVLLVGYNATTLYVNNPLTGQKDQPVNRLQFLQAWHQLGDQALTVR